MAGVDMDGLSSRTLESRKMPGLHFIDECVDVTGWLGGYTSNGPGRVRQQGRGSG
jgi:predicted flavoprotein YhiN